MPIYTFSCVDCGAELEVITPYDERDRARLHSEEDEESACVGALVRSQIEKINMVSESYKPGIVTKDGAVVEGHFGKAARSKKLGGYRP